MLSGTSVMKVLFHALDTPTSDTCIHVHCTKLIYVLFSLQYLCVFIDLLCFLLSSQKVIPAKYLDDKTVYHLQPSGSFIVGGPQVSCTCTMPCIAAFL